MESIKQYWADTMAIPGANWVVAIFGLITSILIAVYVVKAFRDMALGRSDSSVSHLSEFEKMHLEGSIDREEYDRLKKTLPHHLQKPEVSGNDR